MNSGALWVCDREEREDEKTSYIKADRFYYPTYLKKLAYGGGIACTTAP